MTEFDQAYLLNPEFRSEADTAWRRYQDHAGRDQTIGEALMEYQRETGRLMADHRSGLSEASQTEISEDLNYES